MSRPHGCYCSFRVAVASFGPRKVDNHCALHVGHQNEGIRSFQVRRPKFEEGCPEVSIRRAEEVGSQKACINVGHIASPVVDADWHAFC